MDRQRLAAALAYEEERRRRMMESVPVIDDSAPTTQPRRSLRSDLENLSSGLGQGIVNQLEGVKGLITDPVGTVKGTYETVKGVVRDPSVLADALRYTADKAMSGPLGAGEVIGEMVGPLRTRRTPVMQEIDVYHGSPHRFEEFDASKIGTGEGAQAYGHGIYLAESPKVAKEYVNKLGRVISSIDSNPTKDVYEEWAVSALKNFPEPDKAKAYFQNLVDVGLLKGKGSNEVRSYVASVNDAIDRAAGKKVSQSIQGNFYTADLPDEMVDRMLDYDASIKSQPENIRNALQPLLDKHGIARTADIGTLISAMGRDMPQSMVSEKLRELGIPGIKYADAGSRGQGGSGTRNFVVFPGEEKKVKILRRE